MPSTAVPESLSRLIHIHKATSLTARWRHEGTTSARDTDWDAQYDEIKALMMATFATTHSRALQETLYLMGQAVLEAYPQVAEVRFSAPNKHHFLVDFSGFDVPVENHGEVFHAADRPYGLIECTVQRGPSA